MGRTLSRTPLQARAKILELKKKATCKSNQEASRIKSSVHPLTNKKKEQKYSSTKKNTRSKSKAVKYISKTAVVLGRHRLDHYRTK